MHHEKKSADCILLLLLLVVVVVVVVVVVKDAFNTFLLTVISVWEICLCVNNPDAH